MTTFRAFRSPSNVKRAYDELNRTGNSVFLNRNRRGDLLRITSEMSDLQL